MTGVIADFFVRKVIDRTNYRSMLGGDPGASDAHRVCRDLFGRVDWYCGC
jgi:hypothetical protein